MMKPLLVFGLRGTLVERIHVRKIAEGMPAADLTVGLTKVWLRPHMLETLAALQQHCNIAIWSSTTARNTKPLVDAVFNSSRLWEAAGLSSSSMTSPTSLSSTAETAEKAAPSGTRFSKRTKEVVATPNEVPGTSAASDSSFVCPLSFQFVWSREHTTIDAFRRMNMTVRDDAHATVKELNTVWRQFPNIAIPANTILIDDTPSKAKHNADNFLWLDTCEGFAIQDVDGMTRLRKFVEEEIVGAPDVRAVLPRRIRGTPVTTAPLPRRATSQSSSRPSYPHRSQYQSPRPQRN